MIYNCILKSVHVILIKFYFRELDVIHERMMESEGKLEALRKVLDLICTPPAF